MKQKSIIVTGSSGLIGCEVVSFFSREGYKVHGIDNNMRESFFGPQGSTRWNQKRLQEVHSDFEHNELDIRNRQGVLALIESIKPDAIVHTAVCTIASGFIDSIKARTPCRLRMSSSLCSKSECTSCSLFWFHRVLPCGPKKLSRMLLSIPCTLYPSREKKETTSHPINPLEPVTIIDFCFMITYNIYV